MLGEIAIKIPFPEKETLFVESDVYNFRIKDELALAFFYTGRYEEASGYTQELIDSSLTPENEKGRLRENLRLCEEQITGSTK